MENFNLASLPLAILHLILSKMATHSVRDFRSVRGAFRGFNEIGREEYFYRAANLIFMNHWFHESSAVRTFMLMCHRVGNQESMYLRGMYEFFMLHLVDEGWQKIRLAGEREFSVAKYVDGMMNLAFSIDSRGLVYNYPALTREHVDRISHMISSWPLTGHWDYDKPGMFLSILKRMDPNTSYDCWCYIMEKPEIVVSIYGSRLQLKCDHCLWQFEAWYFCFNVLWNAREWQIEDELSVDV